MSSANWRAERLGISPAHSRTRLSRALSRLATLATETDSG
jgi:hypothetical protein